MGRSRLLPTSTLSSRGIYIYVYIFVQHDSLFATFSFRTKSQFLFLKELVYTSHFNHIFFCVQAYGSRKF